MWQVWPKYPYSVCAQWPNQIHISYSRDNGIYMGFTCPSTAIKKIFLPLFISLQAFFLLYEFRWLKCSSSSLITLNHGRTSKAIYWYLIAHFTHLLTVHTVLRPQKFLRLTHRKCHLSFFFYLAYIGWRRRAKVTRKCHHGYTWMVFYLTVAKSVCVCVAYMSLA